MKKIYLFFMMIFSCSLNADAYRAKHDEFIKILSAKIQKTLIDNGVCKDSNDCYKKDLYFFGSGREELHVLLYSMTNMEVVQCAVNNVFSAYKENNFSPSVELKVYKTGRPRGVRFFDKDHPFLTMSIKEEI